MCPRAQWGPQNGGERGRGRGLRSAGWTLRNLWDMLFYQKLMGGITPVEDIMAHKKIERKKELDRRRHRRAERLKQRVREAKAAKA